MAAVWCVDCYDNFLCAEIFSAVELTKIAWAYSRVDSRATLLWYELCEILTKLVTLHLSTLVGQFEMRIWLGDRATLLEEKNWNRSRLIKSQFCPKKFSLLVNAYIFWWIECWSISAQPVRSSPLRWMCAVDISFRHLLPPLAAAFQLNNQQVWPFQATTSTTDGLELQEEKNTHTRMKLSEQPAKEHRQHPKHRQANSYNERTKRTFIANWIKITLYSLFSSLRFEREKHDNVAELDALSRPGDFSFLARALKEFFWLLCWIYCTHPRNSTRRRWWWSFFFSV